MFRLAVLASGRGSNLRALIEASRHGELAAEVVGVFSDKPGCGAVALAREAGIPTVAISARDYPSRLAFDEALFREIAVIQPDLIVCAGYMRILSETVVRRSENRMINLHPSLLPKFPGLDTHARALAAGETEHGASVHWVIPALDAGPVLARARVPVLAGDTPESLAKRVQSREHPLLLRCVEAVAEGRAFPSPMQLNDDNQLEPAR